MFVTFVMVNQLENDYYVFFKLLIIMLNSARFLLVFLHHKI